MDNLTLIESFSEFKDDKLIDRVTLMAILEEVWSWAKPYYEFWVDVDSKNISKIIIDPKNEMASSIIIGKLAFLKFKLKLP